MWLIKIIRNRFWLILILFGLGYICLFINFILTVLICGWAAVFYFRWADGFTKEEMEAKEKTKWFIDNFGTIVSDKAGVIISKVKSWKRN